MSYNFETGKNEYKEVKVVYKHKNLYDVLYTFVVNNKKVRATRLHEFYVKTNDGYKFVKAQDLKIGDLLMSSDGNYYPIRKISSVFKLSTYYDLSIKDNHNYFIGRDNVLVHNAISKT